MQSKQVFAHYQTIESLPNPFRYCPFCATELALVESGSRPRPACPSCGFVQYQNPAPTVSVMIVEDGQVLLGKRLGEPGAGMWSFPSGYVEYDDDFVTAAIREAKEETGLDVEVEAIVNVVSSFISPRFHFLGVYVAAHVVGGELVAGDDLGDVAWFPVTGPLAELRFEEDSTAIELYTRGASRLPVDGPQASSPTWTPTTYPPGGCRRAPDRL